MKTNLEELNYRFRKELLNNYGYRLYFNLLDKVQSANLKSPFNYDAWVKGLYKDKGKETGNLIELIELYYDNSKIGDDLFWNEQYKRGGNIIDFINMSELAYLWVSDMMFTAESYYKNGFVWFMAMTLVNSLNKEGYHKFHHELYKKYSQEEIDIRWMVSFMTHLNNTENEQS